MRRTIRGVFVGAVLVCLAGTGMSSVSSAATPPRTDAAPTGLPSDPKADGYIGFCDSAGHNIVGGDLGTAPFAWKAVSSVSPPAAFQGAGQNAVLNAYQPRPDTRPSEWSGSSLTGASFYTNKRRPAVQATYADLSFANFMATYPPKLNGLYVLRMTWGKRNYGLYSATYPTATIQVQGSRWHLVSGGTVDCSTATKATSVEQLTGVATKQDVTPRAPAANQVTAPAGTPHRITSSPATVSAQGAAGVSRATSAGAQATDAAANASSVASTSGSSHSWVLWSLLALVVLLAFSLAFATRGLRRPRTSSPIDDDPKD